MTNPLDPQIPPAGEEIHLPGPSLMPLLLAVGITFTIIGLTISVFFIVLGLAISIPVIIRWIRSTREEIDHLPPG